MLNFSLNQFIIRVEFESFLPEFHSLFRLSVHKVYITGVVIDFG